MFVSISENSVEPVQISAGSASASPVIVRRPLYEQASRLGQRRTELLSVLKETMTVEEIEVAVHLISEASKTLTTGTRFDGWRRALDDRSIRSAAILALRSNPLLRRSLLDSSEKSIQDAVHAMKSANIGVGLVPSRTRARTHHLNDAQLHTTDMRVGECLADILAAKEETEGDIVVVRSQRATASFAVDMALMALGEAMVTEAKALNVRLGEGPAADHSHGKGQIALSKLLHTLCVEEPRVGEGMRHELARSHVSPAYQALMSNLGLQWSNGCLESTGMDQNQPMELALSLA